MNATLYQPLPYNQMPPFQCAMNERMILSHQEISILLCPYMQFVSLSSNHACTYWDSLTLQALHEHACLFYEKCNVDRVGKMPSNITV